MEAQVIQSKTIFATNQRNTTIDIIRIFAAFGVITIHVRFNSPIGNRLQESLAPFCVPFFFITSLTYFVSNLNTSNLRSTITKAWHRTITPYLAWSFIYISLLIIKSYLKDETRDINPLRIIVYGESAVYLYFLSELLFMQMITLSIHVIFNYKNKKINPGLILTIVTISYHAIGYTNNYFGVTKPLPLVIYIICSFVISSSIKKVSFNLINIITGIILITAAVIISIQKEDILYQKLSSELPIGGIGLLLLGIGLPSVDLPQWLLKLASIIFGIYLSHILFLEAIEIVIERESIKLPALDFVFNLMITAFIFLLSSLFTILCRRNSNYKEFFLGEKS